MERVSFALPPVVAGPSFAIRKPAVAVFTLADYDYVAAGIMDDAAAETPPEAVGERRRIRVAGGTSTGKPLAIAWLTSGVSNLSCSNSKRTLRHGVEPT